MGYFQVRYDSRVVNYDCRGFIRLATGVSVLLYGKRRFVRNGVAPLSRSGRRPNLENRSIITKTMKMREMRKIQFREIIALVVTFFKWAILGLFCIF